MRTTGPGAQAAAAGTTQREPGLGSCPQAHGRWASPPPWSAARQPPQPAAHQLWSDSCLHGHACLRGRQATCEEGKLTEVSPQNSLQRGLLCGSCKAGLRLEEKKKNKQANTPPPPPPPRRAHSPETQSEKGLCFQPEHSGEACLGVRAVCT